MMKKFLLYHRVKKLIALLSVIVLILTLAYIVPAAAEVHPIWDGNTDVTAVEYAGGTGKEEDPFLISNGSQLYKMVSESKKETGKQYFKLTQDIYLNDISRSNWTESANKWYVGSSSYYYGGVFDGAGHTIYGLYLNAKGTVGLFPSLAEGAIVGNLTISDADINTTSFGYTGAIAGSTTQFDSGNSIKISCCAVVNSKIYGNGATQTTAAFVGCVVGSIVIENSYVRDCDLKRNGSATDVAAFTGDGWYPGKATVRNCWSSGVYPCTPYGAGHADFFTCKNVYSDLEPANDAQKAVKTVRIVGAYDLKGQNAAVTLSKFDFNYIWKTTEGYPVLKPKSGGLSNYDTTLPGQVWSGTPSKTYAGGTGTEKDPYLISTGGQLALLVSSLVSGQRHTGEYFKLTDNIYLNDTSFDNWQAEASQWYFVSNMQKGFEGTLDGDGHIVSGLYCSNNTNPVIYCGIIPVLSVGGVVKNIGLVNSEMSFNPKMQETVAGGIVGSVSGTAPVAGGPDAAIVSNCFGDSTVKLSAKAAGGIVGYGAQTTEVNNCYFTGSLYSERKGMGAIVAFNWSWYGLRINNCYAATQTPNGFIAAADSNQTKYTNCYSLAYQSNTGIRALYYVSKMNGGAAKVNMDGLDFDKVWITRKNETPGLRIFEANKSLYSNKHDFELIDEPRFVEISFVTYTDEALDSIYTTDFAPIKLPVPKERFGYEFVGWCTDDTLSLIYPTNIAPCYDITLYAKWKAVALEQGFENYPATDYDMDYDYLLYKMGVADFSTDYVHNGMKSIHRIGDSNDAEDFLLFYEEELQVGKVYSLTFWATTDEEQATVEASFVHLNWPDVNEPDVGVSRTFELKLKKGKWKQFACTFTAQSKWIAMRLSGGHSVFLDDFFFYTSGKNGTVYNLQQTDNKGDNTVTVDDNTVTGDDNTVVVVDNTVVVDDNKVVIPDTNSDSEIEDAPQNAETEEKKENSFSVSKNNTDENEKSYVYLYIIIAAMVCLNAVAAVMLILNKKKIK